MGHKSHSNNNGNGNNNDNNNNSNSNAMAASGTSSGPIGGRMAFWPGPDARFDSRS